MAESSSKRVTAVDRLRGLCMILVILQFALGAMGSTFESWAPILEHGDDGFQVLPGVAFADLFAPCFIFIVGMTLTRSFASRERKYGTGRAYFDMAVRFLSLIGAGSVLTAIEDGWVELLNGETFADQYLNMKIFMIGAAIAAALILLIVITSITKSEGFKSKVYSALRYVLAVLGVLTVFFIAVSAGERTGTHYYEDFETNRFGKYIWDTLQNIGLAGLVALPFVKLSKWGKLSVTLSTFAFVGTYVQFGGLAYFSNMVEGAPYACLTWGGVLLLGSFFMDLREDKKRYWLFSLGFLAGAVILISAFGVVAQKRGCTPAYALLTAGMASILFGIMDAMESWNPKFMPLTWWGGSCILTYAVNYLVCLAMGAYIELAEIEVSVGVGVAIALVLVVVYTLMNYALYKKGKHVKL